MTKYVAAPQTTERWDAVRSARRAVAPHSLQQACVENVRDSLLTWSRRRDSPPATQNPFANIPVPVKQNVLNALLGLRPDGRELLKACHLLAETGLEKFDMRWLDDCKQSDVGEVAQALGTRGRALRKLSVAGQWLLWPEGPVLANKLVEASSLLSELTLQEANGSDLCHALQACPRLRVLHVLHHSLTDNDLLELKKLNLDLPALHSLREIALPSSVKGPGLALALRYLPSVVSVQASCLEDFLETLGTEDSEWWQERLKKMKGWFCSLPLGPGTVPKLVKLCPNIESLGLETSEMTELTPLRTLRHLRALHLANSATLSASFSEDVLPGLSSRLRHLSLSSFDVVDAAAIARHCPRLESLSVLWFVLLGTGPCKPLVHLRALKLRPRSCRTVSAAALRLLLSHCTQLRDLELFSCPALTDELLNEILKTNSLAELRTLALRHGHGLSAQGLRKFTASSKSLHSWTVF